MFNAGGRLAPGVLGYLHHLNDQLSGTARRNFMGDSPGSARNIERTPATQLTHVTSAVTGDAIALVNTTLGLSAG